jgi:hypothetical protein
LIKEGLREEIKEWMIEFWADKALDRIENEDRFNGWKERKKIEWEGE